MGKQFFHRTLQTNQNQFPGLSLMNAHQIGLTICWCILVDLSIFFAMLSYKRYAFYIHSILGIIVVITSLSIIVPILIIYGMNIGYGVFGLLMSMHAWSGLLIVIILGFHVVVGWFARLQQINPQSKSNVVLLCKRIHKIIGYLLIILTKFNIFVGWYPRYVFWICLGWQIIFFIVLIIWKIFFPKLQIKIINIGIKDSKIQIYTNLKLVKHKFDYVIFGDYIYNVEPLKTLHPGGYQIIQSILGRQIDRFIYGMYSSELLQQVPIHSHSYKSLQLVGNPIGKLQIPSIYNTNLDQVMQCSISFPLTISKKGQMYSINVYPKGIQFKYTGYTDIRQLGQYYSLTINKQVTRLYTSSHFIRKNNINLMKRFLPSLNSQSNESQKDRKELLANNVSNIYSLQISNSYEKETQKEIQNQTEEEYIPLMIKKYHDGKLTSKLLSNWNGTVQISRPKGQGLELGNLTPGKIIIVAGGTGLYPFSDLIDLLYKQKKIEQDHQLSDQILRGDPLLKTKPFIGFNFVLFGSFNYTEDIHPITIEQISEISKDKNRFKSVLRIKNRTYEQKQHLSINFTNERFNKLVIEQAKKEKFQKVWICGPPRLNTQIAKQLLKHQYTNEHFLMI